MDDETPDDEEAPVIPLKIIHGLGQGSGEPVIAEERMLRSDNLRAVIQLNDRSRQLLFQVGEVESRIIAIAQEKLKLYSEYKKVQKALMDQAKEAARQVGIDPDDESKGWNLNIERGAFVRTR